MFYSQCLLSRKGQLGAVWVAAYCHKRLKKSQVTETNIPSSVDEIILNEITVTYRVLGYLLLGVVRIYSKKVEYLYHDCSEILTKVNRCVPSKKDKIPLKEAMCAPYSAITLPDRFELDAFNLEILEDESGGSGKSHHQMSIEETWGDARNEHYFPHKYCHQEDVVRLGTSSIVYIPLEDGFSPHVMDMDVHPSCDLASFEASMEKLRFNNFPQEECLDDVVHGDLALRVMDMVMEGSPFCNLTSVEARVEKLRDNHLPQKERLNNEEMFSEAEESLDLGTQFDEVSNKKKRLKFLEVTPPVSGEEISNNVLREDHSLPTTAEKTPDHSKLPLDSELMVIRTPANKEQPRFSRKRKHAYDENMIVLSNEFLRQSLIDASDLVCKRKKAPKTALGAWRASKISKLCQNFMEPLFPCISSHLKALFAVRNLMTPGTVKTVESVVKSGNEEFKTPSKSVQQDSIDDRNLNDQHTPVTDSVDVATSVMNSVDVATSLMNSFDQPTPVTNYVETPTTLGSDEVRLRTSDEAEEIPTVEIRDIDLNLMDEVTDPHEEDNQNLDGWSARTRKVAGYLHKCFVGQKSQKETEALNIKPILEGKTRKESARMFYELLVLKSRGFVDVKQDVPYEDIFVSKTSQLEALF